MLSNGVKLAVVYLMGGVKRIYPQKGIERLDHLGIDYKIEMWMTVEEAIEEMEYYGC